MGRPDAYHFPARRARRRTLEGGNKKPAEAGFLFEGLVQWCWRDLLPLQNRQLSTEISERSNRQSNLQAHSCLSKKGGHFDWDRRPKHRTRRRCDGLGRHINYTPYKHIASIKELDSSFISSKISGQINHRVSNKLGELNRALAHYQC